MIGEHGTCLRFLDESCFDKEESLSDDSSNDLITAWFSSWNVTLYANLKGKHILLAYHISFPVQFERLSECKPFECSDIFYYKHSVLQLNCHLSSPLVGFSRLSCIVIEFESVHTFVRIDESSNSDRQLSCALVDSCALDEFQLLAQFHKVLSITWKQRATSIAIHFHPRHR